MLPGESLQELVGTCGRLRETVVHLVRDLSVLLFLGRYQFPDQVLQPVLAFGQLSVDGDDPKPPAREKRRAAGCSLRTPSGGRRHAW